MKAVEVALQQAGGVDVNQARSSDGSTPLWQACFYGHLDVVRALLGADGIQANQANHRSTTPLCVACVAGHVDVVRELLSRPGVDVTTKADGKYTPLVIARLKGHHGVVSLLVEYSKSQ